MKSLQAFLTAFLGIFMILGGIFHFATPEMYNPFIPDELPELFINYVSGIVEIALGVGLFIPHFKSSAAFGIVILMIALLPLHILDVFKESPAIGSKQLAYIRLPLQFVLIYWAWCVRRSAGMYCVSPDEKAIGK